MREHDGNDGSDTDRALSFLAISWSSFIAYASRSESIFFAGCTVNSCRRENVTDGVTVLLLEA